VTSIKGLYTIADAAAALGLTHGYTLALAKEYGLTRTKVGSSYVLSAADVAALRERPSYSSRRGRRYDRHGRKGEAE